MTNDDAAQAWESETGLALVRPTQTRDELEGIWARWQKMPKKDKVASDAKSVELFGMGNEEHYGILGLLFV